MRRRRTSSPLPSLPPARGARGGGGRRKVEGSDDCGDGGDGGGGGDEAPGDVSGHSVGVGPSSSAASWGPCASWTRARPSSSFVVVVVVDFESMFVGVSLAFPRLSIFRGSSSISASGGPLRASGPSETVPGRRTTPGGAPPLENMFYRVVPTTGLRHRNAVLLLYSFLAFQEAPVAATARRSSKKLVSMDLASSRGLWRPPAGLRRPPEARKGILPLPASLRTLPPKSLPSLRAAPHSRPRPPRAGPRDRAGLCQEGAEECHGPSGVS